MLKAPCPTALEVLHRVLVCRALGVDLNPKPKPETPQSVFVRARGSFERGTGFEVFGLVLRFSR